MSDLGPAFDNAMEYMERDAIERELIREDGWDEGYVHAFRLGMPPDEPKMMTNGGEQAAETRMK